MTEELQRDLGQVEGEMAIVKELLSELRTDVKEIKASFHEMKGGTRTLIGVAAVLGAGVSQFFHWFFK